MTYDPTRQGGLLDIRRLNPFTAGEVGDAGGPAANSNVQQYLDLRRPFKGVYATMAARPTDLADGDVIVVKANDDGKPEWFIWRGAPTSAYERFDGAGSGGGGAMSTPVVIPRNPDGTYTIPGAGPEIVWKGGAIQVPGPNPDGDYTVADGKVTFNAGKDADHANGEPVVMSSAITVLGDTDAQTLQGQPASYFASAMDLDALDSAVTLALADKENQGDLPFATFFAIGELAGFAGVVIDFHRVRRARTLKGFAVTCPTTPGSGSIAFEVLKVAAGGAPVSLFTGALACNGGYASTEAVRVGDAIAAGEILLLKIVSAPSGAVDLRAEAYE